MTSHKPQKQCGRPKIRMTREEHDALKKHLYETDPQYGRRQPCEHPGCTYPPITRDIQHYCGAGWTQSSCGRYLCAHHGTTHNRTKAPYRCPYCNGGTVAPPIPIEDPASIEWRFFHHNQSRTTHDEVTFDDGKLSLPRINHHTKHTKE